MLPNLSFILPSFPRLSPESAFSARVTSKDFDLIFQDIHVILNILFFDLALSRIPLRLCEWFHNREELLFNGKETTDVTGAFPVTQP
jgi:hypothetical protein